jgi:hypothetical protein
MRNTLADELPPEVKDAGLSGAQRILIIRDKHFSPAEGAFQFKLSVADLDAMPRH